MKDSFGREIDYLRLSVTDRCNLRCKYCMPEGLPFIPHAEILRYEEILTICEGLAGLGIRNIRVTGGEPLVREGCMGLLRSLKAMPGIRSVTMTTNGVLLEKHLPKLREIGIDCLNISLDTLKPGVYRDITGRDEHGRVMAAIEAAVRAGLRVKLNCVTLRGLNDGEFLQIAALAERYLLDVRFIESMPIGLGERFKPVKGEELLALLRQNYPDLAESPARRGFGPARHYVSGRLLGVIGVIDAVSRGFCEKCNRVRLTSDGYLKTCLCHDRGVDLKALLRGGCGPGELSDAIRLAITQKPEKSGFGDEGPLSERRKMSQIGG